jgi:hypothetical protein
VEILIRCQELEIVPHTELGQQGVDCPQLQTSSPTGIPESCCFDMIAPVWHEQRQCRKTFDNLVTRAWPCKSLQQFLENQASRYN